MTNYQNKGGVNTQIPDDYASLLGREMVDSDGKKWIYAYAGASLTAKTPYCLTYTQTATQNPQVASLASTTDQYQMVVPDISVSSGDRLWVQKAGEATMTIAEATYTAGHGLEVDGGVLASTGGAFTQLSTEFGVIVTGGATVTEITGYMIDRELTCTT